MADNIDVLAGKIADIADKLTGPGVAAAVEAARMQAYSALAGGAVGLVVAGVFGFLGFKLWIRQDDWDGGAKILACLLFLVTFIASLIGVWAFADPWTWITIQHPELWLAKKVAGL